VIGGSEDLVRLPGSSTTTAAPQAFLAEMQHDAQRNLETAAEFLLRPRQRGLSLLDRWLRPEPAKTDHLFAGVNSGVGMLQLSPILPHSHHRLTALRAVNRVR
jgi:hypothetical protein